MYEIVRNKLTRVTNIEYRNINSVSNQSSKVNERARNEYSLETIRIIILK